MKNIGVGAEGWWGRWVVGDGWCAQGGDQWVMGGGWCAVGGG